MSDITITPVTPAPVTEPVTDTWNVRLVILFLGLVALSGVVGGMVLAGLDKEAPVAVVAICSGAAGALGGILASTRGMRT